MKRFVRFEYYTYYPKGGAEDFTGSFSTLEEAVEAKTTAINNDPYNGASILDIETGEVWVCEEEPIKFGDDFHYCVWERLIDGTTLDGRWSTALRKYPDATCVIPKGATASRNEDGTWVFTKEEKVID